MINAYPRLMVGVPSGFLTPHLSLPDPSVVTVGVEIEPGLGISVDGKCLLVGPKDSHETTDIIGHLPDGSYRKRDFRITRNGSETFVDGLQDHQDFRLEQKGSRLSVKGETPLESFVADAKPDGFDITSQYSGRSFTARVGDGQASVTSGFGDGVRYSTGLNR